MPAPSSSPTHAVFRHLATLPPAERDRLAAGFPLLMDYLVWVPDPRDPRGVRHNLPSLLAGAIAATLTGATSFAAIGQWFADAPTRTLHALSVRWNPLLHQHEIPDESTIRDALEAVDPTVLTAAAGGWLTALAQRRGDAEQAANPSPAPARRPRRTIAVDGKAVRGTRHYTGTGRAQHLSSAADSRTMGVLGQVDVDGKSNELTAFRPLLEPLDSTDTVITADALHTQRDHATFLVEDKKAHYILVVKKNQRALYKQLKELPWRSVEQAHREVHHGHGRTEQRTLKIVSVRDGLAFPHTSQAIQITRKTRPRHGGRWRTVTVYAVTSLRPHQARPAEIAAWIRAHWQIEALHHIRDVTYREDASQIRTRHGPAVMAALRNGHRVERVDRRRRWLSAIAPVAAHRSGASDRRSRRLHRRYSRNGRDSRPTRRLASGRR